MSLFRRELTAAQYVAEDRSGRSGVIPSRVSTERAMRQSVVWAARRLRADLVSLLPVDVYRASKAAGVNVAVPAPPVLLTPDEIAPGHPTPIGEWLYSSQMVLDAFGNSVGVIRAVDALGKPSQIELAPPEEVRIKVRGSRVVEYRIAGEITDSRHVWHERQFTTAGVPIGLSPLMYAALDLTAGLSAAEFAVEWFANGTVPKAILRNAEKIVQPGDADKVRRQYRAAIANGDLFVVGKDWTYDPISAKAAEAAFVDQVKLSNLGLCRFLGVPADVVDVAVDGSSTINYANITQRNLQLLILHLGPSIKRREDAFTLGLVPRGQFVKLNRAAILAMDEKSRAELFKARIDARTMTPDEARVVDDLPPLTEADYAQFGRLFGTRTPSPAPTPGGAS